MVVLVLVYFVSFAITIVLLGNKKKKIYAFPLLKVGKDGVSFNSLKRHKIFIAQAKVMQVDKVVYLKNDNQLIIIKNVDNVFIDKSYLYFNSLGEVKIFFDCSKFYKYFNIKLTSSKFDISLIKRKASLDIVKNLIMLKNAKFLKRYIWILTKVLNITFEDDLIRIKKNKFKLPFSVTYKLNGKLKTININETF